MYIQVIICEHTSAKICEKKYIKRILFKTCFNDCTQPFFIVYTSSLPNIYILVCTRWSYSTKIILQINICVKTLYL